MVANCEGEHGPVSLVKGSFFEDDGKKNGKTNLHRVHVLDDLVVVFVLE